MSRIVAETVEPIRRKPPAGAVGIGSAEDHPHVAPDHVGHEGDDVRGLDLGVWAFRNLGHGNHDLINCLGKLNSTAQGSAVSLEKSS